MNKDPNCDSEAGVCSPAEINKNEDAPGRHDGMEIVYVGDPMCSWCWGISPALKQLRDHFSLEGIPFKIVVGGLRLGGGDPWNDQMKNFLKHHWQEVSAKSGQPFGYQLFEKDNFDYNTEPACRAVVAARAWLGKRELNFFESIQEKFYVQSQDPGSPEFYKSICHEYDLDFDAFLTRFQSDEIKQATEKEFIMNRQWGISGYPSVLLMKGDQLNMVAHGYSTFDKMSQQINELMAISKH